MIVIDNKFEHGDVVYLKTDDEQKPHIVSKIEIFKGGELLYGLINKKEVSSHYEFEISTEKNNLISVI